MSRSTRPAATIRPVKLTAAEYKTKVRREVIKRMKQDGLLVDKPKARWDYECNPLRVHGPYTGSVFAHTKSEAKAEVQKLYSGNATEIKLVKVPSA